ncbi:MAG: Maf family protein [Chthoniobacteraceae bacterium]|jgi:septum formation protein
MAAPLILASASPRRRQLLAERGYRFKVVTAAVEERLPAHLTVRETVLLNARRKGSAVAAKHPGACVVAADTLVAIGGKPLGKPANLKEARKMLAKLSGRTHQVFSGVWIEHRAAGGMAAFIEVSHVTFRKVSAKEIEKYLKLVNVLDKAGAYAAQEDPIGLIESIQGSRTNVIGLPMEKLEPMLARRGYGGKKRKGKR